MPKINITVNLQLQFPLGPCGSYRPRYAHVVVVYRADSHLGYVSAGLVIRAGILWDMFLPTQLILLELVATWDSFLPA